MFRAVVTRPGVAVGSKGYRKQAIGVYLVDAHGVEDDFPVKVEVLRGKDDPDYPSGEYTVHPSSFGVKVNEFGSAELTCTRLTLVSKVASLKKAG